MSDVLCSALLYEGKEGGGREESGSGISAHLPPDHHHPPSFMAAVSCQTPAPCEKIDPPFFFESQFLPLYFSYSSIGTMLLYGIYSDAIIDNP